VADVLTLLILLFDAIVSVWNAYASGYNIGLLKKDYGGGFTRVASYAGLGLAFAGMVYVLVVVLSFLAYFFDYVTEDTVTYALSLNFLVFGALIIGFGLVITIQSVIIASQRRNFWSILTALYNGFAEILDIASYISGFKEAVQATSSDKRGSGNALVIILVAVLIGFFIIYGAFRQGYNKGMREAGYRSGRPDWS